MKCPKCDVLMLPGKAIDSGLEHEYIKFPRTNNIAFNITPIEKSTRCFGAPVMQKHPLNIIGCLKCPECGYSETREYRRA